MLKSLILLLILTVLVNSLQIRKSSKVSATDLKEKIRILSRNTDNGIKCTPKVKEEIAVLVKSLEKMNPTRDLTTSKKIEGDWKLLYTTNEGSSAGKVGPIVGKVNQIMNTNDKTYINTVNIFNILIASLNASWSKKSDKLWEVQFKSIEFRLFNILLKKQPLSAVGIWRKSYIDESMRILYAKGGKNAEKENIYILYK